MPVACFILCLHPGALIFKAFIVVHQHLRTLLLLKVEFRQNLLGLQLLLDVAVEATFIDATGRKLMIEILEVQVDLEQDSVNCADDITELLEPFVCDVCAAFE